MAKGNKALQFFFDENFALVRDHFFFVRIMGLAEAGEGPSPAAKNADEMPVEKAGDARNLVPKQGITTPPGEKPENLKVSLTGDISINEQKPNTPDQSTIETPGEGVIGDNSMKVDASVTVQETAVGPGSDFEKTTETPAESDPKTDIPSDKEIPNTEGAENDSEMAEKDVGNAGGANNEGLEVENTSNEILKIDASKDAASKDIDTMDDRAVDREMEKEGTNDEATGTEVDAAEKKAGQPGGGKANLENEKRESHPIQPSVNGIGRGSGAKANLALKNTGGDCDMEDASINADGGNEVPSHPAGAKEEKDKPEKSHGISPHSKAQKEDPTPSPGVSVGSKRPSRSSSKATEGDASTPPAKKARRSSRSSSQARTLRPRTNARTNSSGGGSDSAVKEEKMTLSKSRPSSSGSKSLKSKPSPLPTSSNPEGDAQPRPVLETNGLCMRVDGAVFVTQDQLDELRIARLTDKNVRPFELLTFQDLRKYNRDQLRAYCFAYGMERRKKTEMEADMARYLSYWNKGQPGFALKDYVPTSHRGIDKPDGDGQTTRGASANPSSTSQDGSVTPSASDARGQTSGVQSSRRGTPARGVPVGTVAPNKSGNTTNSKSGAISSGNGGAVLGANQSQTPGSNAAGSGNKPGKQGNQPPALPRGFGTSFKQRIHAKQAGTKFKAAYNGAGPAIVNIVENAAAYFEGKDTPEVILDQSKSFDRYQFNVDLLTEIFDGPLQDDSATGDITDRDVEMTPANESGKAEEGGEEESEWKSEVMRDIAKRMLIRNRVALATELSELEGSYKRLDEETKHTERMNMRLFQRLERAETTEEVEMVKKDFEKGHGFSFPHSPPAIVRRKLDKSLAPTVMREDKCNILRFKVS